MAFSFGGNSGNPPAAAPTPAPAAGFSFGSTTPSTAPALGAPAVAPAGAPTGAPAGAPTAAPAGAGFSFGNSAPAPATAAPTPGPAAPATGFPAAPAAPATGFPAAPAPTATFGATPAPATTTVAVPSPAVPATTALVPSYGSALATAPAASEPPPTMQVPDFDTTFGNFQIWSKVKSLCDKAASSEFAAQELAHLIQTHAKGALQPKAIQWTPPNHSLRQQMAQRPVVGLHSSSSRPTTTTLTPKVVQRVMELATDLRLSEEEATCLYAQVSSELPTIQAILESSSDVFHTLVERGGSAKYSAPSRAAREFFFFERHQGLETLQFLMQTRLSGNERILEATDMLLQEGLVTHLLQLVREYTHRIMQLMQEVAANSAAGSGGNSNSSGMTPYPPPTATPATGNGGQGKRNFALVHLLFCQQERQLATEILFFIAYHTQLTGPEMATWLDLIRDLTAGLPKPSPFTNVPSPYHETAGLPPAQTSSWPPPPGGAPFQYSVLVEKDHFEWQREFVAKAHQSGQPQILQCIGVLVVGAMAAMDPRQVLHDRQTHQPNSFGQGNQFLPPNQTYDTNAGNIAELHSRLNPEAAETQWGARPDIWGVLAASYALLLRSSPSLLSSPRGSHGRGGGTTADDLRQAARACLELPADFNSFTFCRLTLVPALQRLTPLSSSPSGNTNLCNVSEFGLAVVAEFYAHYLDVLPEGRLPISRQRFKKEEEEELQLRRSQQQQHQQFMAYAASQTNSALGKANGPTIPSSVNLMERPDCLDDLIALATCLSSLGADYARNFWGRSPEDDTLMPSRILQELERAQGKDDSLLPCYLSWLAALANDEASALAVHQLLSRSLPSDDPNTRSGNISNKLMTWTRLVHNLRWYAQELSPYDIEVVDKSSSSSTTTTSKSSTAYYYNLEGLSVPKSAGSTTTTTTTSSSDKSSAGSSSSKIKELSESTRFHLTSHLAVIMNVVLHSPTAQHAVLSITLPVGGTSGTVSGGDEALLVLFKLAIAPLTPIVRGATLATIASLLRPPTSKTDWDDSKQSLLLEQAKHGWEYLESCPLLPIPLLDQYLVAQFSSTPADSQQRTGLEFPPSSLALANSKNLQSLLPKDPNYGILYEMEHVEAGMGWYPSTEGFLQLLTSLVATAGCPSKLGQHWRVRTGCAPYLEYVSDFVLPRAVGVHTDRPQLPFRVKGDQSRLVSRALAVIEAIATRYAVPTKELKIKESRKAATALGIPAVAETVEQLDSNADKQELLADFQNLPMQTTVQPADPAATIGSVSFTGNNNNNTAATTTVNVPRPKSPGFSIMASVLSSSGGVLFRALAQILTDHGGPRGIASIYGAHGASFALSYAIFGSTPPDFSSAKEGAKDGGPTKPLQNLLKALTPLAQNASFDEQEFDDGALWREQSIVLALRIFCTVAAKEGAFLQAIASGGKTEPLKMAPVLRFEKIRIGSSNLRVSDVALSGLTSLLLSSQNANYIRSSIVQYIGYNASLNDKLDAELAAVALSLSYFLQQSMPTGTSLHSLCGNQDERILSRMVARRLLRSSKRPDSPVDTQMLSLSLSWILSDLRSGSRATEDDSIARVLLGLPSNMSAGNWKPTAPDHGARSLEDCFDAILELLGDIEYAASPVTSEVAASCFEILFRLYDLLQTGDSSCLRVTLYTAERLRSVEFWKTNTLIWLSTRGTQPIRQAIGPDFVTSNTGIFNCLAWFLKGLACELNLLVGFASNSGWGSDPTLAAHLAPQPLRCQDLLVQLFGPEEALMHHLVGQIPLERVYLDQSLIPPPEDALKAGIVSLYGASEVVAGYEQVNINAVMEAIKTQPLEDETQSMKRWMEQWNALVAWNCAVSHLSLSTFQLLDASVGSSEAFRLTNGADATVGLQASNRTALLSLILRRLSNETLDGANRGMDALLIPSATRNFSNAALLIAENAITVERRERPNEAELLCMASMMAQTVTFSSVGDNSDVESPTRYERTTVLASALSLLLRATNGTEPDLVRQYRGEFLSAAEALGRLSCFSVGPGGNDALDVVAILARSGIGSIVAACTHEDDAREDSFVLQFMSRSLTMSLFELVSKMDVNICSLLQAISEEPYGAETLIKAGICNALEKAARAYQKEEARVSTAMNSKKSTFSAMRLGIPDFLMSHMRLLSSMLTSTSLTNELSKELAVRVLEILALHRGVFQRLCYNFPNDSDVLRVFMRCLLQASMVANPIDVNERHGLHSDHASKVKRVFGSAGFIQKGISILCEHIMEHPLPRDLLPATPQSLEPEEANTESSIVNIEMNTKKTWWEVLDHMFQLKGVESNFSFDPPVGSSDFGYWGKKAPRNWNENLFEYAIVATDILALGLSIMKRLNRVRTLDVSVVARGLYKCTVASQSIASRIEELRYRNGASHAWMETEEKSVANIELEEEYLTMLGKSVARCVEELLVVSCTIGGSKETGQGSPPKELGHAIELSGLDSKGLGSLLAKEKGSQRVEFVNAVVADIKQLLK